MKRVKQHEAVLDNQLCFPLYAASREIIKRYRPYLEELNLTYTQYIVLAAFWAEKKLSVKELGQKLYLDSGTLTPVLKSLEAKGFVIRYRSTEDERVLLVELTEAGQALRKRGIEIPRKVAEGVNMSREECEQLGYLVRKLLVSLEEE